MDNIKKLIDKYSDKGIKLWTDNGQLHFKAPAGALTGSDKAELKENKQDIIAYLSAIENEPVIHNEEDAYKPFTLTPIQNSYLLGRNSIYDYGGIGCHAYVEVKITPRCDINKVIKAWHTVILRHDMLRAVVEKEGIQRVIENAPLPEVMEMYAPDSEYRKLHMSVRKKMHKKKYESDVYPLHELTVTSCDSFSVLHFSMDMLVADSVSASIILGDILRCYYDNDTELRKPDVTFRDIMIHEQKRKTTTKYQIEHSRTMKYWKDRLDTFPEEPKLPLLADGEGRTDAEFDHFEIRLNSKEWEQFKKTAKQKKLTGSSAVLAAYAEILRLWSSEEHFCINTTIMNRPDVHEQIYDIVGDFTNIDLLEVDVKGCTTFAGRAEKVHAQLWSDLSFPEHNGIEVMHLLNRTRKKQISMPYVYTSTMGIKGLEDSRIDVIYKTSQTPQVFIDCQAAESEDGAAVIWSVRQKVFREGVAEDMFAHFSVLIKGLASDESLWDKESPCAVPKFRSADGRYVSKDGKNQNYAYVTGGIFDKDGNDTGLTGMYDSSGNIIVLGKAENTVDVRGRRVYLDRCGDLLRESSSVKDAYVKKVSDNKADVYVIPETAEERKDMTFDISELEKDFYASVDSSLLEKEIDVSNRYALIRLMKVFADNGIFADTETGYTYEETAEILKVRDEYRSLLKRWLNALVKGGCVRFSDGRYYGVKTISEEETELLGRELNELVERDPSIKNMAEYILDSGDHLCDIISGKSSPLDLFFPEGSDETAFYAYNESAVSAAMNKAVSHAVVNAAKALDRDRIRILEVGAGVGGTTDEMLKAVSEMSGAEYYFTDISNYFLKLAEKRFGRFKNVSYGIFDINEPCMKQGISMGSFDIIIGANVLHNARNGEASVRLLREMLSPDGTMIFLDAVNEPYSLMISKSILHNEKVLDSRADDDRIFFSEEEWNRMFADNGLEICAEYPEDALMKKAELKMYAVRNRQPYCNLSRDQVLEIIRDEAGSDDIISGISVSPCIPCDSRGYIDTNAVDELSAQVMAGRTVRSERLLPENDTEQKLYDIWTELLENSEISTDDNFFEAGGDSLLASMMVTNIRKNIPSAESMEWEKLMQAVLQNPTIKDIAATLNATKSTEDFLIEYQHGSDSPSQVWALFVNGTGTMPIYNQLLQLMKADISENDRIIGLHCGDFEEYIRLPHERVINVLAERNAEVLAKTGASRFNLIGHCFGGGTAIQTAVELQKKGITNVSVVTIDSRRWNVFCDNALVIERGFAEMMGADVSKAGHTVSDDVLQSELEKFVRKHGRLMTVDEICESDEIDESLRKSCTALRDIPQDERLSMLYRQTPPPHSEAQEKQYIMLYKVFYQCLVSFTAFRPDIYTGEVHAIRCTDRSNFFIPVEDADESDYLSEAVSGKVYNYNIDGDHFSVLEDSGNVKLVSEIVLRNKEV